MSASRNDIPFSKPSTTGILSNLAAATLYEKSDVTKILTSTKSAIDALKYQLQKILDKKMQLKDNWIDTKTTIESKINIAAKDESKKNKFDEELIEKIISTLSPNYFVMREIEKEEDNHIHKDRNDLIKACKSLESLTNSNDPKSESER